MSGPQSKMSVGDWMTECPTTIAFDQDLATASRVMTEHAVRHLPVLKEGSVVGVLSDRDAAVIESLAKTPPARIRVVEAMTPVPYSVSRETPLARVVAHMAQEKYGCAIVTDAAGQNVVGIFTTTDALRVLCALLPDAAAGGR